MATFRDAPHGEEEQDESQDVVDSMGHIKCQINPE